MNCFWKFACAFCLYAVGIIATAQVYVEISKEKARINGDLYYIHTVKKSETLYSISKAYGVTMEQITNLNPETAGGLKEGKSIRIPISVTVTEQVNEATSFIKQAEQNTTSALQDTIKSVLARNTLPHHVVKHGETLWSIAKRYGITTDELRKQNPDAFINGTLMSDALLYIPFTSKAEPGTMSTGSGEPYYLMPLSEYIHNPEPLDRPLNVALMLPLLFPQGNAPADTVLAEMATFKPRNTENYYAFYEGALLAVEKLKQEGLMLQLSVYDSNDEKGINELLHKKELQNNDIIIGPVYAAMLKTVAKFAGEHQLKIVSPLDPDAEICTIGNPNFFQVSPPAYCRQKKLIDNVLSYDNTNIIMVTDAAGGDSLLVQNYIKLFGSRWKEVITYSHQVVKGTAIRDSLRRMLKADKNNCIVVASNKEALVSDVAANLYLLTSTKQHYQIVLYGTERWRYFETIDIKYFHALNLHLTVPFFVNYEDEKVQRFVERFQQLYKADPSQYAFQGFDTFYYFLQALMMYGTEFKYYLHKYNPPLLQTDYTFRNNGSYMNGLVNVEACLIHYTPSYTIERQ